MKNLQRSVLSRIQGGPSCKEIADVLQSFLDGELDSSDIPIVEAHLDACRDCGLEAETYEAVKVSLTKHRVSIDADVLARLRDFGAQLTNESDFASHLDG